MTERSIVWQGITPGDAGPYSAYDWQLLQQYIVPFAGMRVNVGPFQGSGTQPDEGLRVEATNPTTTQVSVLPGSALVRGIVYINDGTENLSIAANASGNPRIDTIILEADFTLQTVRLDVLQGTPAASPTPPSLTQTDNVLWQIPLADIAVANGFITITDADVQSRHEWIDTAAGVYIDNVLNNSGTTLQTGDVVVWDNTADRAVTTTTTEDNKLTAGVWLGRTAAANYGRVQVRGVGLVRTLAAVAIGDLLTSSTTAVTATTPTSGIKNKFLARVVQATSAGGLALCNIDVHTVADFDVLLYQHQAASNTAGGTSTAGSWQTRPINTEVIDTGGFGAVAANVITLQPGRYTFWASATFAGSTAQIGRLRWRNTTAGSTVLQSVNYGAGAGTPSFSGFFEITTVSNFELQYWVSTGTATTGLGAALNTGDVEVYATIMLLRHAETLT